ncbi:monofunctional biosynthetic peptidoglycan transglycosylase [Winogradskyella sediminis]|uniref:Biosynthetic peptidoglycan transglycosylase n=1 Tax=Winogradskyella sediminis TaxID=1382466 RepID=A0A1H1RQ04_9FLAO|nr:monofunctional biosynthetic peptidoglycan transglycosylase [Winogradskyella sediminis]SDS37672.1 monofunctional biosynthetic peptidoglycan transglycosylase [Winogradskyella sediminis]
MKWFFRFVMKLCFWSLLISIGLVLLFKYVPVPVTPLMVIRYFENTEKSNSWEHNWVPIENISKNMQLAVICSEDQKFVTHNGFDIEAIEKAYKYNKEGKRIRGGSTISQQTAKNVFLWPERSWLRKGLEVYFTFLIETLWSKERILEVYLNSIEMGPGIYGAEAASQYWFKKSCANLTALEAAAIVSVLPNPRKYRANPATTYIQNRKTWIVKQMRYYGKLDLNKKK